MAPAPLVLGSASPRRAELLARLGVAFTVRAADIDETPHAAEAPLAYVRRMARDKARALHAPDPAILVLTADTTVILGDAILGKPRDAGDARRILSELSGRRHAVCTAITLGLPGDYHHACVSTTVEFIDLTPRLIDAYLATDEPWDKAGAYALQGLAASFVRAVHGSVSNVIGLPLAETRELLARVGVEAMVDPGHPRRTGAGPT